MAKPPTSSATPPDATPKRGRGRPSKHSGEQTRALAIAAGQRHFGAAGFQAVSMEVLAAECGVDARSLYHHFGSKRGLFEAAREEALARFGTAAVQHVFAHGDVGHRLSGYLSVMRTLHTEDPYVLPFIGRVVLESFAGDRTQEESASGEVVAQFLETLVDDAIARGELHPDLDPRGTALLLRALGMGFMLASLDDVDAFPAMLDAVGLLTRGQPLT